ncbi:MAG: 4-hydroxy-tetrahydrodipicolinate synthase [Bryobacteraceae bacterium]|nr:4-hydroxy-tetrahydrodipicolinate synthase [Bryobacteraceae bacterium]
MKFRGCGTALVTPFHGDGSVDEAAFRALVRRQIDAGIDFLVPCGTTGESPTLRPEEHLRVVEITLEESDGRTPVLAGAGGYNTREVIELAAEVADLGADGILSVTPYYNKPTQEGLIQHYAAIEKAVGIPIIVYSVKGRTGVNVEPSTVQRLAAIDGIAGIKEASGDVNQMGRICADAPDDFAVLSGDDSLTLPLLALGGHGLISVVSNVIPKQMTELVRAGLDGNFSSCREIHRRWLPLMDVLFVESNPIPVKAALAAMGLLQPVYRLPMVAAAESNQARIQDTLRAGGLI